MIRRHATLLSLLAATAAFVVMFVLLDQSDALLRIVAPSVLALATGAGLHMVLARAPQQAIEDSYREDAERLADRVRAEMREVALLASRLDDEPARQALLRASHTVAELLERVAEDQPNALYSSASRFQGHVESLKGVVEAYLDISEHPHYYRDGDRLREQGRAAMLRFDEFTIESMQLLTQGDMAEYQANLDTVAPPAIPKLEER